MARRSRTSRRFPSFLIGRVAAAIYTALALVLLYSSIIGFVQGRYLVGRYGTSSSARDAWDEYGAGAFAAESAVYLVIAGAALAFLVCAVVLLVTKDVMAHIRLVSRVAFIAISTTGLVSLGLLIVYWASGVPFRNFQPMNMDWLLYPSTMLIPLMALLGVALVVRQSRRRLAPNVRRLPLWRDKL